MSQATLTLRPPPNVEFVQGYPGIPPGADRPQAAVKGAIEVRAGQQGVKAKWVRIELRKVEVLPGGGQAGTFFDYVGQSPVNLWTGPDGEYGILRPISRSIFVSPNRYLQQLLSRKEAGSDSKSHRIQLLIIITAGIKYELIAMVCIKGKKGFFRRDKSTIVSTASQIIIDKHELHSTWPIYSQPETRSVVQDGVTLIVQRGQTCYGPGDRIIVNATIKADTLNTILLRGFEFTLRESTVFRTGPGAGNKKGAPQVKVAIIAEQKVPVNATLYGGTQHKAELTCTVPSYHTSATINAARHIDITYILNVKALMGTGLPIAIDLPVVVSNWPKTVSLEAARRIGPVPNLSLVPGQQAQPQPTQPVLTSTAYNRRPSEEPQDKSSQFNTAPTQPTNGYVANGGFKADEFGYGVGGSTYNTVSGGTFPKSTVPSRYVDPRTGGSDGGRPGSSGGGRPGSSGNRPGSSGGRNRLLVANMGDDIPEESPVNLNPVSPPQPASPPPFSPQQQQRWLTAEEEKKRLYERAVARVEQVQGIQSIPPPEPSPPLHQPIGHVDAGPIMVGPNAQPPPWSTAEQEKLRLYDQAQAAARRIQGHAYSLPPETTTQSVSVGAALYSDAMLSMRREPEDSQPRSSPESDNVIPRYSSPQTEKEMMKRYYDAKAAASRNQGQDYVQAEPISYDALYPSNHPNSGVTSQPSDLQQPPSFPSGQDDPPAFTPESHLPVLSEKERLRRHYEAQDAAANTVASPLPTSVPTPVYMPSLQPSQIMSPSRQIPTTFPQNNSPPPPVNNPPAPMNAFAEKEILRKKYEAEDAARQSQNQNSRIPPATPSRSGSALPPIPRSPPIQVNTPGRPLTAAEEKAQLAARYANNPPASPTSPGRPLTAAEEKAQLKAQYEVRDRVNSQPVQPQQIQTPTSAFNNVNPNNTLPTPPPLKPRPPVDYINQTKEEDTRTHSQYLDLERVGSIGSPREQGKPDFSRQFSLKGPTTNGNGNAYSHES
ncbi:hypothetical protein BDM02DRAFT_3184525 [Thelephora ganbajun]|uniref:Uncharacterized protein n=1 Tax=Thelephora ganbajun TaxID=370292 RepID=A0ACB6ZQ38_THEGA|nr:hypothetical protein BDM02DRAFT_3184525 [Thelephora ganbajun]